MKPIRTKKQLQEHIEGCNDMFEKYGCLVAGFKKVPNKRTINQNNLMWMWIDCICEELGYKQWDRNIIKIEIMKILDYGSYQKILGENVFVPEKTSKMNTKRMSEFMNDLQNLALTEFNISLPNPDDKYFEEFYIAYKE